jgi:hypothetical protein
MAYVEMKKLKKNSVSTTITGDLLVGTTTIPVAELAYFRDADGTLITKGIVLGYNDATEAQSEEITITGASGSSGAGNLTGATRGIKADGSIGQAYAWPSGTRIAVMFSTTIYEIIKDNFIAHESGKAPNPFFDYRTLYPGGAMVPTVDPAGMVEQYETTTNKNNYVAGQFTDGGTDELQWLVDFPEDWDGDHATLGKIIITPIWTAASGSGTVKFVFTGKLFANDDALDTALAAIGDSTDTLITAEDVHVGPASTAAVISPISAGAKTAILKVTRDSANDTLNATARLIAVRVKFIRTLAYT